MQPQIEYPHGLISWWTMEKFAAEKFCNIASQFAGISAQLNRGNVRANMQEQADLARRLTDVAATCDGIGLKVTALQLLAVAKNLTHMQFGSTQVSQMVTSLGIALTSEMSTHLFMRVFPERAPFYEQPDLFGPAVATNFDSASRDIKSAGTCFSVDRNTACVMHLMRVLEIGLSVLASELGVTVERRNWENVINDIEAEIKQINGPAWGRDWKSKQQFYSEAAKDFRYFKDAWRNHAMHYREHYDATEAKSILEHVKTFMSHLAENGLKETAAP